jgi:hypothetical protein
LKLAYDNYQAERGWHAFIPARYRFQVFYLSMSSMGSVVVTGAYHHALICSPRLGGFRRIVKGRLDFDSLISGIDTVSIPESLGIDSYRYRIDSS